MMVQKKRFLSLKEVKKIEGEKHIGIGVYEVITDLKFADLFRSMKYKIGLIYALAVRENIVLITLGYPNKQELYDRVKVEISLEENDFEKIDFGIEGRKIRDFILESLGSLIQLLSLLPDTIEFYHHLYERMDEEVWKSFSLAKELVDGLCCLETSYLPQDLIKTVLEKKIIVTPGSEWEEKFYPLVKHLLPDNGKRFFVLKMQEFYNLFKDVVTQILSGEEPEYVEKKIKFVPLFDSYCGVEPLESEKGFVNGS